jgi:hypothetical protein
MLCEVPMFVCEFGLMSMVHGSLQLLSVFDKRQPPVTRGAQARQCGILLCHKVSESRGHCRIENQDYGQRYPASPCSKTICWDDYLRFIWKDNRGNVDGDDGISLHTHPRPYRPYYSPRHILRNRRAISPTWFQVCLFFTNIFYPTNITDQGH